MFDNVIVDVPLPDGWVPKRDSLQTKCFENILTTLRIKEDRRIYVEDFEYEEVPIEDRPYAGRKGLLGLCGTLRKVNMRWRDLNFHGWCYFYGSEDPADYSGVAFYRDGKRYDDRGNELSRPIWHGYRAKFTDGLLVEIIVDEQNSD